MVYVCVVMKNLNSKLFVLIIFLNIYLQKTNANKHNLYEEFTNKLNQVSDYSQNKLEQYLTPYIDKILENNSKYIDDLHLSGGGGDDAVHGNDVKRDENGSSSSSDGKNAERASRRNSIGVRNQEHHHHHHKDDEENENVENLEKLIEILGPYLNGNGNNNNPNILYKTENVDDVHDIGNEMTQSGLGDEQIFGWMFPSSLHKQQSEVSTILPPSPPQTLFIKTTDDDNNQNDFDLNTKKNHQMKQFPELEKINHNENGNGSSTIAAGAMVIIDNGNGMKTNSHRLTNNRRVNWAIRNPIKFKSFIKQFVFTDNPTKSIDDKIVEYSNYKHHHHHHLPNENNNKISTIPYVLTKTENNDNKNDVKVDDDDDGDDGNNVDLINSENEFNQRNENNNDDDDDGDDKCDQNCVHKLISIKSKMKRETVNRMSLTPSRPSTTKITTNGNQNGLVDPKSIMNLNPSAVYPSVIAKNPELLRYNEITDRNQMNNAFLTTLGHQPTSVPTFVQQNDRKQQILSSKIPIPDEQTSGVVGTMRTVAAAAVQQQQRQVNPVGPLGNILNIYDVKNRNNDETKDNNNENNLGVWGKRNSGTVRLSANEQNSNLILSSSPPPSLSTSTIQQTQQNHNDNGAMVEINKLNYSNDIMANNNNNNNFNNKNSQRRSSSSNGDGGGGNNATNGINLSMCSEIIDPTNATDVLERVLEQLELIRQAKNENGIAEGSPCNLTGSWNSEIIGMRFDMTADEKNNLQVKLMEHDPPKRDPIMDSMWKLSGATIHQNGGPFYIVATRENEEILATFTGICKTCEGIDTIFGTWSFIHPARDCRDLLMSIETKRDIFRKEMLHIKRLQKLEKLKQSTAIDGVHQLCCNFG